MDIPRYWRLRNQRYRLEGRKCNNCGNISFPPRIVCKKCKSREAEIFHLEGRGKIFSFTKIYQAPDAFDKTVPYAVALVDLVDGVRITAQLSDIDIHDVRIGMDVELVIRRIYEDGPKGPILYGYKFRPLFTNSARKIG